MIRRPGMASLILCFLAGCGADAGPCDSQSTHVTLRTLGPLALLTYRELGAPATVMTDTRDQTVDLCVSQPYEITVVCVTGPIVRATQYRATPADDTAVFLGCDFSAGGTRSDSVHVTGTAIGAGSVYMGGSGMSFNGLAIPFDLPVARGTHDLVASNDFDRTDGQGRVLVRRSLRVDTDLDVGDVDPEAEGTPLAPVPFTLSGLLDTEQVSTTVTLQTGAEEIAQISRTPAAEAHVLPAALARSSDHQDVSIAIRPPADSASPRVYRYAEIEVPAAGAVLELVPPLSGLVSFEPTSAGEQAGWISLPDYARLQYDVYGASGLLTVSATRSWIDTVGATSVVFDATVDGYDPAWSIGAARSHFLSVTQDRSNGQFTSSLSE